MGDPTTNTTVNATSIITANIYTAALTVGNAITNAVIGAAGLSYGTATLNAKGVFIGANVSANMTTIAVGTAGSNTFINSTALSTSNVITANLYANLVGGNTMYVGNAATNAQLNATSFSLATVTVVNTTGLFVGANVSVNTTTIAIGVGSTNTVINSTATVSGNAVQNSTGFYYGANVVTNATSMVVGSATVNTVQNSSGFYVGQNVVLGVANLIIGSGATNVSINSTAFSGVANNATNFAGQGQAFYANVTNPTINVITVGNGSIFTSLNATNYGGISNNSLNLGGHLPAYYANVTSPNFSANISVSTNVFINASVFSLGSSSVNTTINSTCLTTSNVVISGNSGFTANLSVGGTLTVAGNLVVTGSLQYSNVATGNFIPSAAGQLLGNSSYQWQLYATYGTFYNDIQATTATFSGLINLASVNIIGNINASANTVSNNMLVTGSLVTGAAAETAERSFTLTTTGTSAQLIDSFVGASYRCGRYFFYVSDLNNNNFYISESMILFDSTNVLENEFGSITSNSVIGSFNSNASAGVVRIYFTPTVANTQIRVNRCLFIS